VDVVIFTVRRERLEVLLIRRRKAPFADRWAIPGGFVDMDESLEQGALRELEEETGVRDVYLEQLYTFGAPGRDPRGRTITVAYYALVNSSHVHPKGADDASEARWFDVRKLPPLAFDHDQILDYALRRLRSKLDWTAVGAGLLPAEFTFDELHRLHEVIQDRKIDSRQLRRQLLGQSVIEPVARGRYRFVPPMTIQKRGSPQP
jgi:8-oxo-dGTP diphosphatase